MKIYIMTTETKRGQRNSLELRFNPRLSPHNRLDQISYPSRISDINDIASKQLTGIHDYGNFTSIHQELPGSEDIKPWQFHGQDDCNSFYSGTITDSAGIYCNSTWDDFMCWPPTAAGSTSFWNCPPIQGVDETKFAYRKCGSDGLWLNKQGESDSESGWTDYTKCFIPEVKILLNKLYAGSEEEAQMKYLVAKSSRAVELIGLMLSLVSLLLSMLIFTYFKKLQNNRIRIHKHQFMAMLLQVVVRIVLYVDQAIVKGDFTGLASHVVNDRYGIDNTPIICEAFYIILEYGRSAMFMWMFIEAMYLNNLISVAFFQGPADYRTYYLIGWGIPVLMTSLWVVMMMVWDSKNLCWFGYSFRSVYWILEGPRFVVIGANLLFLLNIMRILISKLREANSSEAQKIRPLHSSVRNALFLLPLLGITNAVTIIPKPLERSAFQFGVWSYGTNLLTSFQGFVVACIYCFFNADIKRTMRYFWRLKVTLRPSHKSKTTPTLAFSSQDGHFKEPKLHYKSRKKSSAFQLQNLHPEHNGQNRTLYDTKVHQPIRAPFVISTSQPS